MTSGDIRHRMTSIGVKAAALSVVLYDLIEEMDNHFHSKHLDFQMSPRGQQLKENLDRLERWHETVCGIDADGLTLE